MKSANRTKLSVLLLAPIVFVAFQNCAPVRFQSMESDGGFVKLEGQDLIDDSAPISVMPPQPGSTPAAVATPVVANVEAEEPIEVTVEKYKSDCAHLTNDAITYDSIADTNSAAVAVSGTGGTSMVNRENISTARFTGGTHTVTARSIASFTHTGGRGYVNASKISQVRATGGSLTAIANEISSWDGTGGTLCISADLLPSLSGTGGYMVAQGRSSSSHIPKVEYITGGTHAFKNFKIDSIDRKTGGTLILENCEVDSITNITGGQIILINSKVNLIRGATGGQILSKGSTIGSVENVKGFTIVD